MDPFSAIAVGLSLYSGYMNWTQAQDNADAMEIQNANRQRISLLNTQIAEYESAQAFIRGNEEVNKLSKSKEQILGTQSAAFASQGLDISSGTAALIQDETRTNAAADIITIQNNAWKEAWGFKVQALKSTEEGRVAELASKNQISNTLMTGNLSLISGGLQAFSFAKEGMKTQSTESKKTTTKKVENKKVAKTSKQLPTDSSGRTLYSMFGYGPEKTYQAYTSM